VPETRPSDSSFGFSERRCSTPVEDVQGDALCSRRIMLNDIRAQGNEVVDRFGRPYERHTLRGRWTLFCRLPRADPLLDALVRNAFAAVERGEGSRDAGDLPLVRVEIRGDCLGGEERTRAPRAFGESFEPAFRGAIYANRKCVCAHMCTVYHTHRNAVRNCVMARRPPGDPCGCSPRPFSARI
jgi:hypothetical protein